MNKEVSCPYKYFSIELAENGVILRVEGNYKFGIDDTRFVFDSIAGAHEKISELSKTLMAMKNREACLNEGGCDNACR